MNIGSWLLLLLLFLLLLLQRGCITTVRSSLNGRRVRKRRRRLRRSLRSRSRSLRSGRSMRSWGLRDWPMRRRGSGSGHERFDGWRIGVMGAGYRATDVISGNVSEIASGNVSVGMSAGKVVRPESRFEIWTRRGEIIIFPRD